MAASSLSFDDMIDMPLDSSPLKSPPSTDSPAHRELPPIPDSPTPQGVNVLQAQRKRPAEDLSQFATGVARAHKLVKTDHDELTVFSKLGRAEQSIATMGHLLALRYRQSLLQPVEAAWVVPARLHINERAAILIADSSLPAYRDTENSKIGPAKLLMDMVLKNPEWGLSAALREERDPIDAVSSDVSRALIAKRSIVKTAITSSLGSQPAEGDTVRVGALNVIELSTLILTKLKVRVEVDIRLCGRVALLRKLISEGTDNKYWGAVDKKLGVVRKSYPDAKDQSRWIKQRMLDPDLLLYKHADLTKLAATASVPRGTRGWSLDVAPDRRYPTRRRVMSVRPPDRARMRII